MSEHAAEQHRLPAARHERGDVRFRQILALLALILACLLICIGLAMFLYPRSVRDQIFGAVPKSFPAPQLQEKPRADMQAFYAAEMQRLNGLGWVDREQGIVHIPIGQAMQDVARSGIPGWPARTVGAR